MIPVAWKRRVLLRMRRWTRALRFAGRSISVHPSTWIAHRARLSDRGGGAISIGKNCEIHPYARMLTYGGEIREGDDGSLNPFAIIYGYGGVHIGCGVRIAAHTVIVSANHVVSRAGEPFHQSGVTGRGVRVEDNVWIGASAVILDGVTIGRNSIVAAGSVVTRPVPAHSTVAGVPARVIATRGVEGS
jgi:acetyltransferase-like isoleucine patch superfamily enzyme